LKGGLSFFVAFALTSWVLPLVSPAPSADPFEESPGSKPAAAAPTGPGPLVSEDLEVPDGIELASGQGLIEIETAGPEAIHIDGSPVGNGPIRRVPAVPGVHRVEVRGNGWTLSHEVTLVAGRRARVRSTSEPAAGPTTAR
jgi:hypothetical protein